MTRLSISLLGSIKVLLAGEPVTRFEADKALALLAYLAVEASRPHRRETLAGLLWPDQPERTARHNLSQSLLRLRQAIADREASPPFLLISRQAIQFNPDSDYWLDVTAFLAQFSEPSAASQLPIQAWHQAVDLYRGDFLDQFFLADTDLFEEWALSKREQLRRLAMGALQQLAGYYEEQANYELACHYARRQVELDPLREEAQRHLMQLLGLSGQRSAALAQYETCRRILAGELGLEPAPETTALYEEIRTGLANKETAQAEGRRDSFTPVPLHPARAQTSALPPCPYRSLFAFGEEDAPFFFGRELFIEHLAAAVRQQPVAALIGPSGSGKTSVISAGLLPRLRREKRADGSPTWLIASFRVGGRPFHTLAGALARLLAPQLSETGQLVEAGSLAEALSQGQVRLDDVVERIHQKHPDSSRFLLVGHHFEELYSLCPEIETRHRFLDTLLGSLSSGDQLVSAPTPWRLVLTLRADFMGQALAYRPLADVLQGADLMLGPMTRQELRQAIEKPAERMGVTFETGLVERILDDVANEPGNLPLLEFALAALWEHQGQGQLSHAAYEAIGRVAGALVGHADRVYTEFSPAEQDLARQLFVQLVHPGEGTEDSRRLASRPELSQESWALARQLADARLVVIGHAAGRETVEVAHEALIHRWERLRQWMETDRTFRAWQERLRAALRQWLASDQDEAALLRGLILVEAETWLAERGPDLSQAEAAFIQASQALRQQQAADREREQELQRQRQRDLEASRAQERRFQRFTFLLVVMLLIAIGTTLYALYQ